MSKNGLVRRMFWLPIFGLFVASTPAPAVDPAANPSPPRWTQKGLVCDLDADHGVETEQGRVINWKNQVEWKARDFRPTRNDGKPSLREHVAALNSHNSIDFEKQELINDDEDAFDHLTTGSGYTWFAVLAPHEQVQMEKDVDAFFGNLKNGGNFEGFWGCLNDDNSVWIGSRNSLTFGRFDDNNPKVQGPALKLNQFYVIAGRMGSGAGDVMIELFVNEPKPVAAKPFHVVATANASKMAIGQERDAQNHPGRESFKGELARIMFYDRPLTDEELAQAMAELGKMYGVSGNPKTSP